MYPRRSQKNGRFYPPPPKPNTRRSVMSRGKASEGPGQLSTELKGERTRGGQSAARARGKRKEGKEKRAGARQSLNVRFRVQSSCGRVLLAEVGANGPKLVGGRERVKSSAVGARKGENTRVESELGLAEAGHDAGVGLAKE